MNIVLVAAEAIEHARVTFARQMRSITLMELGLTVINGFLIVAVIGYAIVRALRERYARAQVADLYCRPGRRCEHPARERRSPITQEQQRC